MRIARVFPTKTNMTPEDDNAYYDYKNTKKGILRYAIPTLETPKYDEVHISVVFTWDMERAKWLKRQWQGYGKVKLGGPAFGNSKGDFIPGKYLKKGITITSRGCNKNCSFCFVPRREGKIKELPIKEGNIIQDNNLLACSKSHIDKVFQMLRGQKRIEFTGGLDKFYINDHIIEQLRGLSIYQIFLAYDNEAHKRILRKVVTKLRKYFTRRKIRCYVLIGYEGDTIEQANKRLYEALNIGTLPFAMRYKDINGEYIYKNKEWHQLTREWTRPAIIKTKLKS